MPLQRVRLVMTNFSGAPGTWTFYSSVGAPPPLAAIKTFFEAIKGHLPNAAVITYPGTGDEFNETTGTITGSWTSAPPAVTTCTGAGNTTGASGYVVEWLTSAVVHGRRPIGKTFIVPVATTVLENDGSPSSAALATATTAAAALVTATTGQLFIWHRPVRDPNPPHTVTRLGDVAAINSSRVPDLNAVMRSRRR
jgi:hypothetical protein